jgi:hypothetical protein
MSSLYIIIIIIIITLFVYYCRVYFIYETVSHLCLLSQQAAFVDCHSTCVSPNPPKYPTPKEHLLNLTSTAGGGSCHDRCHRKCLWKIVCEEGSV